MIQRCRVADFSFEFQLPNSHPLCGALGNYRPFLEVRDGEGDGVSAGAGAPADFSLICFFDTARLQGSGTSISWSADGVRVLLAPTEDQRPVALLSLDSGFATGALQMTPESAEDPATCKYALDTALMVQFAFYTASRGALLLHASAVMEDGRAVAFLGKSGTGKSTHSRLWLEAFPGTALLNDDNPVVRIFPDEVRIYGTPWSGKTPCYKQISAPLHGLVRLRQAPANSMVRLKDIEAYLAVSSSVSASHLKGVRDLLHDSISALVQRIPIFRLDCLPNVGAAQLCHENF